MKRIGIYIMICFWVMLARAQGIAGYEYWFDNYFDNRASAQVASGDISLTLDVSTLGKGIHYLNFRAKDNAGLWSSPVSYYFFRAGVDHSQNQLTQYEYWLDNHSTDRKLEKYPAEANGLLSTEIDVAALKPGIHYINLRVQDSFGMWSSPVSYYFFRSGIDHSKNQLTTCEYWIDNQHAHKTSVIPDAEGTVVLNELDMSTLNPGVHYFNFRAQDAFGVWSSPVSYYFYRAGADHSQNQITNCEYWLDNQYDQRTKANIGTDGTLMITDLDVSNLTEGAHYFNFRAQDSFGAWSNPVTYYFYRLAHHIPLKNLITHYRYMFNNEKSTEKLIELNPPVNPLEWKDKMIEIPEISITQVPDSFGLKPGTTTNQVSLDLPVDVQFTLQFKDSTEQWSSPVVHNFKHHAKPNSALTTLSLNKAVTIKKPMEGNLLSYRIDVMKEDSIYWKADQPCAIALFNSSGEWVDKIGGNELLKGKTIKTPLKGSYYAVLHGAIKDATYTKEEITFICIGKSLNDTIHVEVPGTLPNLVGDPDILENLTLTGYLNGTDIKFIRSLPRLIRLDIGGAHIVEGGDAYYQSYLTANEVTGDYMFSSLSKLIRLILSESTTELGASALEGCSSLTELTLPASIAKVGNRAMIHCTNLLTVNWNSNASIDAAAFSPSEQMNNCLIFAPAGTEATYQGNVILGGIAEKITLTHAKGFRCPTVFKAKDITYTRNFSMTSGKNEAAGWETIVLPFAVQEFSHAEKGELAPFNSGKEGTKPFWLRKLNVTNGYEDVTVFEANTPYIISMPNSPSYEDEFNIRGTVTFHAENTEGVEIKTTALASLIRTEGPNFITVPSFEATMKHDTVYAINLTEYEGVKSGGAFIKNLRNVNPFETYTITKESPAHAPKMYSIGGNGGSITGLDDALLKQDESLKIYAVRDILYIESDKARTIHIYGTDGRTVRIVDVSEGKNEVTKLEVGVYFLEGKKIVIRK